MGLGPIKIEKHVQNSPKSLGGTRYDGYSNSRSAAVLRTMSCFVAVSPRKDMRSKPVCVVNQSYTYPAVLVAVKKAERHLRHQIHLGNPGKHLTLAV